MSAPSASAPRTVVRVAVGLAALFVALFYWHERTVLVVWGAGLCLALALALRELLAARSPDSPAAPRPASRALFLVGVLCALAALLVRKPNTDDAVYVHIAVAAADHPGEALFATDTLHGLPTPSPILELYRAQSFELLQGALALLTGLRAIDVAHLLFPALLGFFLPYAQARLLRLLVPGRWFWALLCSVAFLLTVGDSIRSYASLGLVRLMQGKSVFLSLGVPLLVAYALEFALAPSRARWLRLAALQIASIGLTSCAFWLAPAVSGLTLAAATPGRKNGLRTLCAGVLASGYLVLLGLLLLRGVDPALLRFQIQEGELHAVALGSVLGASPAGLFCLFCLAGGTWALADSALLRRVAVFLSLGFFAFFWNPFARSWLAEHVTGVSTYWRIFWLIPMPVLVACVLTAPLVWFRSRPAGALVTATLAVVFFVAGPQAQALEDPRSVGWPQLKVPPYAFAAAELLTEHSRPGAFTLAPFDVCPWIGCVHGHPVPLMVRPLYFQLMEGILGVEEIERRKKLELIVSASAPGVEAQRNVAAELRAAIADYDLECICLDVRSASAKRASVALEVEGFERIATTGPFEIWKARARATGPAER